MTNHRVLYRKQMPLWIRFHSFYFTYYSQQVKLMMSSEKLGTDLMNKLRNAHSNYPELQELLVFYEKLFQLQCDCKAQVLASASYSWFSNKTLDTNCLVAGIPQVSFRDLKIEQTDFVRFAALLFEFLNTHFQPRQKQTAIETSDRTALEAAQKIFESGNPIIVSDAAENINMLAAGLALLPYLHLVSDHLMPHIDQSLWQRKYCPICGGKPSFAALENETGARSLLCSRCSSVWRYSRIGCPFCENTQDQVYYPSDNGRYRLYVCDMCQRYLKTIDLRVAGDDVCLTVENIITVAMDIAAQEKGYRHY